MFPWMGFDVIVVARLSSFPGGHDRGRFVVADTLNDEAHRGPPNRRRRQQRRWSRSRGGPSNLTKSHVVRQREVQRQHRLQITSAKKGSPASPAVASSPSRPMTTGDAKGLHRLSNRGLSPRRIHWSQRERKNEIISSMVDFDVVVVGRAQTKAVQQLQLRHPVAAVAAALM